MLGELTQVVTGIAPPVAAGRLMELRFNHLTEVERWVKRAGISYRGPDKGIKESLYFRDPDGIQLELLSDDLMYFGGQWLDGR